MKLKGTLANGHSVTVNVLNGDKAFARSVLEQEMNKYLNSYVSDYTAMQISIFGQIQGMAMGEEYKDRMIMNMKVEEVE